MHASHRQESLRSGKLPWLLRRAKNSKAIPPDSSRTGHLPYFFRIYDAAFNLSLFSSEDERPLSSFSLFSSGDVPGRKDKSWLIQGILRRRR